MEGFMMKTSKLIKLLPLTTLLLTGCFDQSISKEDFAAKLEEINQNLNVENEKLKNCRAQSRLGIETYNYKEGEYYSYKYFALILIIPVSYGSYTWKDDAGYHNFEDKSIGNDVKSELTEEEFNTKMEGRKATILGVFRKPYEIAKALMDENYLNYLNPEGFFDYSLTYANKYTKNGNTYKIISTATYTYNADHQNGNDDVMSVKYTITFKDNLPTKLETEKKERDGDKSKDHWKYSYSNSAFSDPTASSEQSE